MAPDPPGSGTPSVTSERDEKETSFSMNNSEPHKYCSIPLTAVSVAGLCSLTLESWQLGPSSVSIYRSEPLKLSWDGVNCEAQRPRKGPVVAL